VTLAELVARADRLAVPGTRRLLGIVGAPGAGKSTLAGLLARELGATVVPLDGFHLSDDQLRRADLLERKGAPETFDAAAYVALLRELHLDCDVVRAPSFDRTREETVADAIIVPPDARLVITEGNYLLLPVAPWGEVRDLLDETWFLDTDESSRIDRLVVRHVSYGWPPDQARARATAGSDAANARLIAASRERADLIVTDGWMSR
jgi:pantothenate kinase